MAREAVCYEPSSGQHVPLLDLRSEDLSCHASALSDTSHTSGGSASNAPILPALMFLVTAQTLFTVNAHMYASVLANVPIMTTLLGTARALLRTGIVKVFNGLLKVVFFVVVWVKNYTLSFYIRKMDTTTNATDPLAEGNEKSFDESTTLSDCKKIQEYCRLLSSSNVIIVGLSSAEKEGLWEHIEAYTLDNDEHLIKTSLWNDEESTFVMNLETSNKMCHAEKFSQSTNRRQLFDVNEQTDFHESSHAELSKCSILFITIGKTKVESIENIASDYHVIPLYGNTNLCNRVFYNVGGKLVDNYNHSRRNILVRNNFMDNHADFMQEKSNFGVQCASFSGGINIASIASSSVEEETTTFRIKMCDETLEVTSQINKDNLQVSLLFRKKLLYSEVNR